MGGGSELVLKSPTSKQRQGESLVAIWNATQPNDQISLALSGSKEGGSEG